MRQQGRTSMNQRGDSPQRSDLNNHVMAQLNSQINNIDINDLPPPPPVPHVMTDLFIKAYKLIAKNQNISFICF